MAQIKFERPIAHRGLHDPANGVIENSASAFVAAIDGGFGIECDLELTGDGVPMVFHDARLDRLTGQSGLVSTLSAAQMARIPLKGSKAKDTPIRFTDMLDLVAGRAVLQVELKTQANNRNAILAGAAAKAVKNYKGPLVFISFDPRLLRLLRDAGYYGETGIIIKRFDKAGDRQFAVSGVHLNMTLQHLLHWPVSRFDFISCNHTDLDLPAVRFLRKMGFPVTTWVITSPQEAQAAASHADQIVFSGYLPAPG